MATSDLEIYQFQCLDDNFGYLVHDPVAELTATIDTPEVAREILDWQTECAARGVAAVLLCYALGKAQRLLMLLDQGIGPVLTHGAVENVNEVLRGQGIALPDTRISMISFMEAFALNSYSPALKSDS